MLTKTMLNYDKVREDSLTSTKLKKIAANWNGKILLTW